MSRRPSRRGFLAAVGAGSFALAGCTGLSDVGVPGGQDETPTSTENAPTTEQPTESPTTPADGSSDGPGTVIEDFEDLEAWASVRGEFSADEGEAFAGSQSVRVENPEGSAGIFKAYPEGLDLSSESLSIAVKMEEPTQGKLSVELRAPGPANQLVSNRTIVEGLDDWARVDLGYTGRDGEPDPANVQEIRITVVTDGEPVRFWVDDLRKAPRADRGKVILSFDDAHSTHYDVAFPELQERGWSGVEGVIPPAVGTPLNTTIGQLREMRDAGWDIASHPQEPEPLTAFPKEEQRQKLEDAQRWLNQRGFPDGARFFFAPYNQVNGDTLEVVSELHEYGFTFGGCPNGVPPAGRTVVSRINARDAAGAQWMVDMAEAHGQLTVLTFHGIGPDFEIAEDDFVEILDHVESADVDVITPSELLELE